jgi:hypothetical protein
MKNIFIALMMEAVHTSETSVFFNETKWCYIQESCHLHTHRCENLKSHEEMKCPAVGCVLR